MPYAPFYPDASSPASFVIDKERQTSYLAQFRSDPRFRPDEKCFDRWLQRPVIVIKHLGKDYYLVHTGNGPVMTRESDLVKFHEMYVEPKRNGVFVKADALDWSYALDRIQAAVDAFRLEESRKMATSSPAPSKSEKSHGASGTDAGREAGDDT